MEDYELMEKISTLATKSSDLFRDMVNRILELEERIKTLEEKV